MYYRHQTLIIALSLIYYPRQIAGTNLLTSEGWITLLARAHIYAYNLFSVIYRLNLKARIRYEPRPKMHTILVMAIVVFILGEYLLFNNCFTSVNNSQLVDRYEHCV